MGLQKLSIPQSLTEDSYGGTVNEWSFQQVPDAQECGIQAHWFEENYWILTQCFQV